MSRGSTPTRIGDISAVAHFIEAARAAQASRQHRLQETDPEIMCQDCGRPTEWARQPCTVCRVRSALPRSFWDLRLDASLGERERAHVVPPTNSSVALTLELAEANLHTRRLVFAGPTKSGKSTLACAMAAERIARGSIRVGYEDAHTFIASHAGKTDVIADRVDRMCRVGLAVIDEVGREDRTWVDFVAAIVGGRAKERKATWILTPFTRPDLVSRYDEATARRIYDDAVIIRLGRG